MPDALECLIIGLSIKLEYLNLVAKLRTLRDIQTFSSVTKIILLGKNICMLHHFVFISYQSHLYNNSTTYMHFQTAYITIFKN